MNARGDSSASCCIERDEAVTKPRILVVTTGGTIASRWDATARALRSVADGDELLASLGACAPDFEVTLDDFVNLGSNLIDLETAFRLARHIEARLHDDAVVGCVVAHGTDTLEESAFLTSLVVASEKPVAFTGAQRGADAPDADGPGNLADAMRVAASPEAVGLGTVVVFDGAVLGARDATKVHASRAAAFASPGVGPLGMVDRGELIVTHRPTRVPSFPTRSIETRVDLIALAMGADARLFDAAVESGARGVVLEAFGRGNATPAIVEAVARARATGVTTIVASRCPEGRVLPLYGDGGGRDLEEAGAIFAGGLRGPKARILLCLALANVARERRPDLFRAFGR